MSRLKNQLITIGELDELIGLADKNETTPTSGFGGRITAFDVPDVNIRAKVRYERTNEGESAAKQEKFTTEIKCIIRENSNLTIEKYVYWREKYYDIYAIEDTPGQRFQIIKARLIET